LDLTLVSSAHHLLTPTGDHSVPCDRPPHSEPFHSD
jgi:hypothetical protein